MLENSSDQLTAQEIHSHVLIGTHISIGDKYGLEDTPENTEIDSSSDMMTVPHRWKKNSQRTTFIAQRFLHKCFSMYVHTCACVTFVIKIFYQGSGLFRLFFLIFTCQ